MLQSKDQAGQQTDDFDKFMLPLIGATREKNGKDRMTASIGVVGKVKGFWSLRDFIREVMLWQQHGLQFLDRLEKILQCCQYLMGNGYYPPRTLSPRF